MDEIKIMETPENVLPEQGMELAVMTPKKEWYEDISLEDADNFILANCKSLVRNTIAIGYYLKYIRDHKLYLEAGCADIYEYADNRYGLRISAVSRCIKCNTKYSKGGNSPFIDEQYRNFNKSQLQEMLPMNEEQLAQITPDMTVRQIRELKKPKETPVPYVEIPGQIELTDFPGITAEDVEQAGEETAAAVQPKESYTVTAEDLISEESREKPVATSQMAGPEPGKEQDTGKCLHRPTFNCTLPEADKHIPGDGQDCTHSCCWNCVKHGSCRLECYSSAQRPLSAYDTPKKVYPEGSLIVTEGCEGGHYCFSCAMECEIRGKDRYCREAPIGNPFPCEHIVLGLKVLKDEIGDKCQFINHDLAEHCAGSGEVDPCCKNCSDPCEYICERAMKHLDGKQQETEPKPEEPDQDLIDAEFTEVPELSDNLRLVREVLAKESKDLDNWLNAFAGEPPERIPPAVGQKKIIVAALAAMLSDLEDEELKQQLAEEKSKQPELPALKNNEQRKAFMDAYETWPIWIELKETGERYYRYELPDAAMVVKAYYHRCFDYNSRAEDWEDRFYDAWGDPEYYLVQDGKHFHDCLRGKGDLIDYLKTMQKKG